MKQKIKKLPFSYAFSLGHTIGVRFPLMFFGYFKDIVALSKESSDTVFLDLKNLGLHIFPDRISDEDVKRLLDDFESLKLMQPLEKGGQASGRIYAKGILSPAIGKYAEIIKGHAKKFFNTDNVRVEISYYQESYPANAVDDIPGGELHVDDNKANLKYFIYLTDVKRENGPFSCIPSTGSWRLRWSILRGAMWELTHKRKYLYGYLLDAKKQLKLEMEIVGCSGTNFLVDTTTLHRAQPLKSGSRKVMVVSFNRGNHV